MAGSVSGPTIENETFDKSRAKTFLTKNFEIIKMKMSKGTENIFIKFFVFLQFVLRLPLWWAHEVSSLRMWAREVSPLRCAHTYYNT